MRRILFIFLFHSFLINGYTQNPEVYHPGFKYKLNPAYVGYDSGYSVAAINTSSFYSRYFTEIEMNGSTQEGLIQARIKKIGFGFLYLHEILGPLKANGYSVNLNYKIKIRPNLSITLGGQLNLMFRKLQGVQVFLPESDIENEYSNQYNINKKVLFHWDNGAIMKLYNFSIGISHREINDIPISNTFFNQHNSWRQFFLSYNFIWENFQYTPLIYSSINKNQTLVLVNSLILYEHLEANFSIDLHKEIGVSFGFKTDRLYSSVYCSYYQINNWIHYLNAGILLKYILPHKTTD